MKEIITQEQVDNILRLIAIAAPIAGLIIGAVVGLARKRVAAGLAIGIVTGLTGTAMFGLWRMYTAFGDGYGYTSAVNLTVQLALFTGIGVGAGFMIQKAFSSTCNKKDLGIEAGKEEENLNAG